MRSSVLWFVVVVIAVLGFDVWTCGNADFSDVASCRCDESKSSSKITPRVVIERLIAEWHATSYVACSFEAQIDRAQRASLQDHLISSVLRLVLGVGLGAFAAICLAISARHSKIIAGVLNPPITFLSPVPVVVWIPLFISMLGLGEFTNLAVVAFSTLLIVYLHTSEALASISSRYTEIVSVYYKGFWPRVLALHLPGCAPGAFTGLRLAFAFGWVAIFIAEASNTSNKTAGLGYYIWRNLEYGKDAELYAGIALLAVAGFAIDMAVVYTKDYVLRWQDNETHLMGAS